MVVTNESKIRAGYNKKAAETKVSRLKDLIDAEKTAETKKTRRSSKRKRKKNQRRRQKEKEERRRKNQKLRPCTKRQSRSKQRRKLMVRLLRKFSILMNDKRG